VLPKPCSLRALQQPKQYFPFEHGSKRRNLHRPVAQAHHPPPCIQQIIVDGVGPEDAFPNHWLEIGKQRSGYPYVVPESDG